MLVHELCSWVDSLRIMPKDSTCMGSGVLEGKVGDVPLFFDCCSIKAGEYPPHLMA